MRILRNKIVNEGALSEDQLALFLTQELDVKFLHKIAKEFKNRFNDVNVTKIVSLDIHSNALATVISSYFGYVPVVILNENLDNISEKDNILIVSNFLENITNINNLVDKINANIVGIASVIQKVKDEKEILPKIKTEILTKVYFKNGNITLNNSNKRLKMLVMTASTGNGHNQAANNLKLEIEKNGDECKIVNIFRKEENKDDLKYKVLEKGYDLLIQKMPQLYSILYKLGDQKLVKDIFSNMLIIPRIELKKIIKSENPDIIISTHPFAVPLIMSSLDEIEKDIPYIQIITDFKPHEMYIDQKVDGYIAGSEYTKEVLIKKGIEKDKIYVYGIPIKKSFLETDNNKDSDFNLLVMGGSMGLTGMEESTEVILKSDLNVNITVVCGNNEKMEENLRNKFLNYINDGKLRVLGFVNNIDELMDKAKLIITKPGGLTSTEAIGKNLPIIIPFCIPGQEKENTDFLVNNNMAMEINKFEDLPKIIELLMKNRELYEDMVNSMKQLSQNYSIDKIIYLAKALVNNEK